MWSLIRSQILPRHVSLWNTVTNVKAATQSPVNSLTLKKQKQEKPKNSICILPRWTSARPAEMWWIEFSSGPRKRKTFILDLGDVETAINTLSPSRSKAHKVHCPKKKKKTFHTECSSSSIFRGQSSILTELKRSVGMRPVVWEQPFILLSCKHNVLAVKRTRHTKRWMYLRARSY